MKTRFTQKIMLGSAMGVLATLLGTASAEAEPKKFNIEAQDLSTALLAFGEQSGVNVAVAPDLINGKLAPAVQGLMEPEEALALLLSDTELETTQLPSGAITVTLASADETATEARPLDNASLGEGLNDGPIQLAQSGASMPEPTSLVGGESEPVAVTGTVKAFGSDANLKGAQVEILETGQRTATNDLGRFRFASVTPGNYTLRITYLGRDPIVDEITVDSSGFSETYTMGSEGTLDTIFVYGSRSARAQALNQERTAENSSTIVSSDLLGEFGGQTLSETLRRAPGVSFQRDDFTGDGTNIIIRGLEPDLNAIKLNGVELPEGSGLGRSANLGNIQTESISEVRISKTLLANQDSAGSGGLVEIETKSPLDRPDRFASFSIEGSQRENDFNDEFIASGTVSRTFGSEGNFGLSASVQYRERDIKRVSYSHGLRFGEYLPLQIDGSPTISRETSIDPRLTFPFEPGVDDVYPSSLTTTFDLTESEALSLTLSGAWQVADHTNLRFDFQRSDLNETRFNRRNSFNASTSYLSTPIVALGGEERRALTWRERVISTAEYNYLPDIETITDVYSFRGESVFGNWELDYTLGFAEGTTETPQYTLTPATRIDRDLDPSLYQVDAVTDPVEGRILSIFPQRSGDSVSLPLLTDAGFAFFNDPGRYDFGSAGFERQLGNNERFTADFSARYNFENQNLKYIEAGFNFEDSDFGNEEADDGFFYLPGSTAPSLQDLGVGFDNPSLNDIGVSNGFNVISISDFERLLLTDLPNLSVSPSDPAGGLPGSIVVFGQDLLPQFRPSSTNEREFAAFVQGRYDIGKLEIIGGLRLSQFEIESSNVSGPFILDENFIEDVPFTDANTVQVTETATQTEVLPRFLANYRQSDNLIFRAGYFQSIGRPQIELLSDNVFILLQQAPFFGPTFDQPQLRVQKGNSDLEAAKTHSLDFNVEYYDDNAGVIKFGVFYKRIDNLLESNVSDGVGGLSDVNLPDDPRFQDVIDNPDDYDIVVTIPLNNPDPAEIWGVEAAFERQFTELPGAFGGLGVFANYTYTDSSKDQPFSTSAVRSLLPDGTLAPAEQQTIVFSDISFNNQPEHSGTFGLTYNKFNIDANIAYTAQSRYQTNFRARGLDDFEEAFDTLDMRVEYRFDTDNLGNYRVFFEGVDLLRGSEDPSSSTTRGVDDGTTPKYFSGGRYFGGRQLRLGLIATF